MKSFISRGVVLAAICLSVSGLRAQSISANAPDTFETLPATSPYGEAIVKRNIPYTGHPTPRQNFDLYLPKTKSAQPFPLIIWIHGGAWMSGFKVWDNVKYLVAHGYAIASVDYRFSQDAPFPAQIWDCNAAMNFILAHATNYGVSTTRFVVGGGSAGGHLALLLGLARNENDFGANPKVKPLAILDFFGPADFNSMKNDLAEVHSSNGLALFQDVVPKLLGAPLNQAADKMKLASPMTYVNAANPPVLILQGGKDDLVPAVQSRRLHDALDRVGVKNQLIVVAEAGHDGPLFSTPEIAAKVIRFLDDVLEK
ncbi:MAG TPA: alpha/beta hydrolase [Verrucomicrobiae bacterium]|nr:alpha/beta hydrolase [Verrucomicrobiae bacterium]